MSTIVMLSSCNWGEVQQRPHHMARAFAQLGYCVYFIQPSTGKHLTLSEGVAPQTDLGLLSLDDATIVNEVHVVSCVFTLNGEDVRWRSVRAVLEHIITTQVSEEVVVVVYLPAYARILRDYRGKCRIIYDCVDDHLDFENAYWSQQADIENEFWLLRNSDLVLTTSAALYLSKAPLTRRIRLSRNAVDPERFIPDGLYEPEDLRDIPHPRIVYSGAVDRWFDKDLLYGIARSHPDKSFVILGYVREGMLDVPLPNLYILGPRKHAALKHYLRHCDVGIIPFQADSELIIHTNPIKLYEYIACGLPVISTPLPEVHTGLDCVRIGKSLEDWNRHIEELLVTGAPVDSSDVVNENTWLARASEALEALHDSPSQDLSATDIEALRAQWQRYSDNPVILSLLALTYVDEQIDQCCKLAFQAYQLRKSSFTFRTYILALFLSGRFEEAAREVISSTLADELYRAEVAAALRIGDLHLVAFTTLLAARQYHYAKVVLEQVDSDSVLSHLMHGHYAYEIQDIERCLASYRTFMQFNVGDVSPLLNRNIGQILKTRGHLYVGERLRLHAIKLVDHYLNNQSRLQRWISLFTEDVPCEHCGSTDLVRVVERPDGQWIVACQRCGLAFLQRMPAEDNLKAIYDTGYYDGSFIGGYQGSFYSGSKSYIFVPRVEWIQRTMLYPGAHKILDIGCADGEFLEYMARVGWDVCGLEISDEGCQKARARGIDVVNLPLREAKFESDSFDCVTLWDVIEHYRHPKAELREIYRILKPNGMLFLSTPNHRKGRQLGQNWFGYCASYEHLYYFEPSTLVAMLCDVGFRIDDVFTHDLNDWSVQNVRNVGHVLLVSAHK